MAKLGQKRGKYKPRTRPRPRTKYAKTVIREQRLAAYLAAGMKHTDACRKAGFPESVIKTGAGQIVMRPSVQEQLRKQHTELVEQGRAIDPQDLGNAAKARIQEGVGKFKANAREGRLLLGFSRTAAEMAGMLGGPSELHLHNHPQMSPIAIKMMAEMTAKILMDKNHLTLEQAVETVQSGSGITLDVEAIRPKPVDQLPAETLPEAPPTAIEAPASPTFEERQNDHLRFHANLMQGMRKAFGE